MRLAYADPPYVGQAKRHYAKDPSGIAAAEVDHVALFVQLETYDGWALSASSPSLLGVGGLAAIAPTSARIGAWVKPFASFKPGVNPAYAWEPVIFKPMRKFGRDEMTVRDWTSANITLQRGTHGAKPTEFCFWLFSLLGATSSDEFTDLFPGSGNVGRAWDSYCRQSTLPLALV